MHDLVRKIVEQVFSSPPTLIEEIKGKGKNNLVFKVELNDKSVILRLSNREKTLELYKIEKWCSEVVRKVSIPTPKIMEIGFIDGYTFSFQEFIDGIGGIDAKGKLSEIWFTLGQYANTINKILAPNLVIDYEKVIKDLFSDSYFVTRNIFSQELSSKIQNRLEETIGWKFPPTLCHGNLHPSNVIIDQTGVVYVIDWETATGNKAPQSEFAEIYTWNNGKENISHFSEGYGLKENEVKNMMRDIQTLVLLRLVNVIVRKMPKDNNWEQDNYIKETAIKLANIIDYQQDILFTKNL